MPVVFAVVVLGAAGCSSPGRSDNEAKDVEVEFKVKPQPPRVGPAEITLRLEGKEDHKPVKGATLRLEGNMNHAGMKPVFADAKETEPGRYEASFKWTMGGDWYVEVTGTLADGRTLKRKIDVPGVKSE
jgi:hypothetical protein